MGSSQDSLLGIARGGAQIRKCKTAYDNALDLLIKLASLQTSFQQLDEAMKVTNRRENTLRYISSELDEREREDLFRLKKVVSKKKRDNKIAEEYRKAAEKRDRDAQKNTIKESQPYTGTMQEPQSMLDEMQEYDDPADNVADAF